MPFINQTECFSINKKFWRILGFDPLLNNPGPIYRFYAYVVLSIMVFIFVALTTMNFYFLESKLDIFIGEMVLYLTEFSIVSQVVTFIVMRDEIANIFKILDNEVFQPKTEKHCKILEDAKRFYKYYWKLIAAMSVTSCYNYIISPIILHLFMSHKLELSVCSYSFIPEETKQRFIYALYLYQSLGLQFLMWCSVNIPTFFLGLMILVIAQLDILDDKLRNITVARKFLVESKQDVSRYVKHTLNNSDENVLVQKLNESIVHFDKVNNFCSLIQRIFGVTLFVQFGISSIIICICLFRFTLPAPLQYLIFLATYTFVMIIQILVPCWFGTRIIDKSRDLSIAVYECDWTPRGRRFKTNLRLFVERTSKPLYFVGWKMFPISLTTFTSIMNSSYSFFALLRHMQSRQ